MKIGTLFIDIYAELLFKNSVEILRSTMDQNLATVTDKFDFDHKRFGYFAAQLKWVVPLKIFWKNDTIYNNLKKCLNTNFKNWTLDISIIILQKGG
jgi:hypothetical protein